MNRILLGLSLCVYSVQAFAVCEAEYQEYNTWSKRCSALEHASTATMIIGAVATIPFLGVGGLAGLLPGGAAKNACRIKKEKFKNYKRCLTDYEEEGALPQKPKLSKYQLARQAEREKIKLELIRCQVQAEKKFSDDMHAFLKELSDDGYDLTHPDTLNYIDQRKKEMEADLEIALQKAKREFHAGMKKWKCCGQNCECVGDCGNHACPQAGKC